MRPQILPLLFVLTTSVVCADTFPAGFTNEVVASSLSLPTSLAFAPGNRLFISTRSGVVRLVVNGSLQAQPFADLSAEVGARGDRGLLGIAVHPDFPAQPYVYVLYTHDPAGVTQDSLGSRVARLVRLTADAGQNYNVALTDAASRVVLMGRNSTLANVGDPTTSDNLNVWACRDSQGAYVEDCIPQDTETHAIGHVMFGSDGMLYAGNGDSSSTSYTDPRAMRAQDLDSMVGKVFRIDPVTGRGLADNPFYDGNPNSNRSKVFAYGLRNPFRFAQHPQTGIIYIGDVGWNDWEEVNTGRAKNFGWPCYEGGDGSSVQQLAYASHPATSARCQSLYAQGSGAVQQPLIGYGHNGAGAAVILGGVYQGTSYPEAYRNALFYGDYNTEIVRAAKLDAAGNVTSIADFGTIKALVSLTPGLDGDFYYIGYGDGAGTVYRIRFSGGGGAPTARITASPTSGAAPLLVNFDGRGSTDPENQTLTYSWDFGTAGATSTQPNPSYTYSSGGSYTARLTVTDTTGQSSSAQVTIQAGSAPAITMITPAAGALFAVGDRIDFSGSASDTQDGSLSSAIRWTATLNHNDHQHIDVIPLPPAASSGSFIFPDHGQNTYITLCARVTDSSGLSAEVCREIRPRVAAYTFNTNPQGLQIVWDGVARTAPFSVNGMVNSQVDIAAPTPQQSCRVFASWSDGSTTAARRILIGSSSATLTANFDSSQCGGGGGGLVGHWRFDEGGGVSSIDASGNNNTATLVNAGWSQGRAGASVNFNGSGDSHARINGSASLNSISGQVTVSAWTYKHTNRPSWSTVASRQLGALRDNQWYLSFLDGRPAFGLNAVGSGDQNIASPNISPLQAWVHIAGTYDGAALRIYVNGVLAGSRPKSGLIRVDGNPLLVAANQNDNLIDLLFNGRVDELRLYNRALSDSEIFALFNDGAPPSNVPPSVSLTGPANGATYTAPAAITFSANASDPDGSIQRVEFYNGATKVGEDISAPYTYNWTNVPAGNYQLSARAFDSGGASASSASVTVTVGAPAPADVRNGLVGQWRMDEGFGPVVADASGLGNTARLLFCNWAPGLAGTAMKFYGDSNSHLRINASSSLNNLGSSFTVAAWINRDFSQSGAVGLMTRQRGNGSDNAFFLGLNNNRYSMRVATTFGGEREALGGTAPLGQWVHVAATYDGNTIRLYVNGAQVASTGQFGNVSIDSGKPLLIAANQNNTITDNADLLFDGRVDDARIYNRALPASEIQAVFNRQGQ
jgi:glucose/arabinose dehydrogenase